MAAFVLSKRISDPQPPDDLPGHSTSEQEFQRVEEALLQSENRYRRLVDFSPMGVVVHHNQRIIFANPASATILGAQLPTDLLGLNINQFLRPESSERLQQRQMLLETDTGSAPLIEERLIRMDGTLVDVELSSSMFLFEDQPTIQMVIHNISDRKRAEASLASQLAFEKLLSELSAQIVNATHTHLASVIQHGLSRVAEFLDVDRATLYEIASDQKGIQVVHEYTRPGIPPASSLPWSEHTRYLTCLHEGQIIAVEHIEETPAMDTCGQELWRKIGVKSGLAIPVLAGGALMGKLALSTFQREHVWPSELVARIRVLAEVFISGMARARAEESEYKQRVLAEALRDSAAALNSTLDLNQVLDNILVAVERVVPYDTVDIMMLDGKGVARIVREKGYAHFGVSQIIEGINFPLETTPILRNIVLTGQPYLASDTLIDPLWVVLPETTWIRSYAAAPIISQGRVLGFINLTSLQPNFFQPEHLDRLRAFTDQAGLAFNNAHLLAEARQARDRLQVELWRVQALQEELREQAIRDPLTGLYNRRYLQETMDREIARANREGLPVAMIEMDIDHFKVVNDTYGHQAGDEMLKELALLIQSSIRGQDIACRMGGEEFVIVMPGSPLIVAQQRAEQIRATFDALRVVDGLHEMHATMSCGISIFPLHGVTGEEMLICADRALYIAKQTGRNRVVTYQNRQDNNGGCISGLTMSAH